MTKCRAGFATGLKMYFLLINELDNHYCKIQFRATISKSILVFAI